MKQLVLFIFRVLFGLVFMFSGFVKAVDPLGSMYKFEDYFVAFGFGSLVPLALILAIALAAIEFLIGANLVLGSHVKKTSWVALFFMAFMTPLTLYIAIANPVTDCGCFGDAWVIDNWTTFHKNIILSIFIITIFVFRNEESSSFSIKSQWIVSCFAMLFSIGISVYGYVRVPLFDFRPYKIGANIIEGMTIPDDAPHDEYRTTFIYEKDGKRQQFTLDNFPAGDSTWTFVKQQSVLISKGFRPPIYDFSIDYDGNDITYDVLENSSFTFLVVSSKLEHAKPCYTEKINNLYAYAQKHGYAFYCLTSSFGDAVNTFRNETGATYPIAFSDEVTLKTIIRTNPGVMLIKDATVYNKWHCANLPTLTSPLQETQFAEIQYPNLWAKVLWLFLLFCIPVGAIYIYDTRITK
jgi:uncharacterized membrane protein YphA (DoxX/SURF4 family)